MKLYTFEMISSFLGLLEEDKAVDKLIFNSAYSSLEKYLGFELEEKTFREIHEVLDGRIILDEKNVTGISEIFDMDRKTGVGRYALDYDERTVFFLPRKCEGHAVYVVYKAGFSKSSFPADLKEVLVKMFAVMKINFLNRTANTETAEREVFTDDVKRVCNIYRRKWI